MTLQNNSNIDLILNRLDRGGLNNAELHHIEEQLRHLYNADQSEGALGNEKYKLFVAKALIEDHHGNTKKARESMEHAIKLRGHLFTFADEFLEHLDKIEEKPKSLSAKYSEKPDFQKIKEELRVSNHSAGHHQETSQTEHQTTASPHISVSTPISVNASTAESRADDMIARHREQSNTTGVISNRPTSGYRNKQKQKSSYTAAKISVALVVIAIYFLIRFIFFDALSSGLNHLGDFFDSSDVSNESISSLESLSCSKFNSLSQSDQQIVASRLFAASGGEASDSEQGGEENNEMGSGNELLDLQYYCQGNNTGTVGETIENQ